MAEQKEQLAKPKFIKLSEVKPGVHGFNAYAKVLSFVSSIEKQEVIKSNGEKLQVVDVTLGDETAIIKGHFVGKYSDILEEGKVYAIRNGKSTVFKEHHRLELDGFGKITKEKIKIEKVNNSKNLSDVAYEKVVKTYTNDYKK